jgi:integrase
MGTVFKKQTTRPVPAGAEIIVRQGRRFARWKTRKGKTRTAPLTVGKDGSERIRTESRCYVAKFKDGAGIVQTIPTGCRDETAARQKLAALERRAELIRSGVMSSAEDVISRHQTTPLSGHFDAYEEHLKAKGVTGKRVKESRYYLDRLAAESPFSSLADLRREALERWLAARTAEGMSARNRNAFREIAVAFANWCCETDRLLSNPFGAIPKANTKTDPRRPRRAMAEPELVRLLSEARRRPMVEALTIRRGPRKGQLIAKVKPHVRERLELLGWERELIYKTLVLSGLRKGELTSLTVGQLALDGPDAYAELKAADEKNRQGSYIAIRDDLAADLRQWLSDKLRRHQDEARCLGMPIPARLPLATPVFNVPKKLYLILNRDLKAAGIPKRDERGRTLDVHALRTTFATLMSCAGVFPRTAQAAMRHSTIDLTMNVYTDTKLLDVHGALDVLPLLPLHGNPTTWDAVPASQATGTEGSVWCTVGAPNPDCRGQVLSLCDNLNSGGGANSLDVSGSPVKRKDPLTTQRVSCPIYPHGDSNPGLLAENQTS